jgi:3-hydroxybutyrate dehydrogenase
MERISLVTGASRGIGRATALRFAKAGDRVFACGRDVDALRQLCIDSGGAMLQPLVFDVASATEVERALDRVERLDVLVASAGICRTATMESPDSLAVWKSVLETNLSGAYYTIAAALPKFNAGGRIVLISSGLGKLGRAGYEAYCASKHGVLGLMRCLSRELAPRGITVNAVCPGWVDTQMAHTDIASKAARESLSMPEAYESVVADIAIGRMVAADEVAALIEFIVSSSADALTGEAFNISGGEFFT